MGCSRISVPIMIFYPTEFELRYRTNRVNCKLLPTQDHDIFAACSLPLGDGCARGSVTCGQDHTGTPDRSAGCLHTDCTVSAYVVGHVPVGCVFQYPEHDVMQLIVG